MDAYSQEEQQRAYEGTASASRKNNDEEQNALMTAHQKTPKTANQGDTYSNA